MRACGERKMALVPICLSILPIFLLWFGVSLPACAQQQKISQMDHTVWTGRDGAPQNINALAQTADGMLWLGTRDGLYSFDGITFSPFYPTSGNLPRKNVETLLATKEGELWAVAPGLPPTRIRQGVATVFDRADRGTPVFFGDLQRSSDGTMWALMNKNQLVRLDSDGIWHVVSGPKPQANVLGPLFIDSSDTQWLVAEELLYRRSAHENKFVATNIPVYDGAKFGAGAVFDAKITEGQDRSIWIIGSGPVGVTLKRPGDAGLKHLDDLGKLLPGPLTKDDVNDIAAGDDGSIWLSHVKGGLEVLRASQISGQIESTTPDVLSVDDGLENEGDRALLRDRDGNIWIAGTKGLERFQNATLLPALPKAKSGLWSVCAAPNGDVWLSLFGGFSGVVRNDHIIHLKDELIGALACGKDGRVRVFGNRGIGEVRGDHVVYLPLLPGHGAYWARYVFFSLAVLPDGRLIASTIGSTENGLWSFQNGKWEQFVPNLGVSAIQGMMADAENNLYLGSNKGEITVLQAKTFDVLARATLEIGAISGFSQTSYGVFALGQDGIALEHDHQFRKLSFAKPEFATSVTGLVEDRTGHVWINGSRAIARISAEEIAAAVTDASHPLIAREFREGNFRGSDFFGYARNSAQIDARGTLWFPTSNGVVYIDPQHLDRALPPPSLSIRSITADGQPLNAKRTLGPGTQTLDVRYFGLNLSDPTHVVYRYRLKNYEAGWQDAGNRTEAIYTHLRPGKYLFQVAASNGDGIWTKPSESELLTVLPAYYQTWWFGASCIAISVILIWVGLTLRVRYVSRSISMRAEERADERIRIARELHDTLLQGVQGLLLTFHVAAEKVPVDHESKKTLERALTTADRIILEGRNRVSRLRSDHLSDPELKASIERVVSDLDGNTPIELVVERKGGNDTLQEHVVDEIFCIAREALTNVFRHSQASRVVVELDYQMRQFRFSCHDNGRGFDAGIWQRNEANGHWGLRGIAERAEKIGGKFSCASSPGQGTNVQVSVPARRAYVRANGFRLFSRRGGTQ
jgi:signal transduction histidine kinase/ligand-binding sensor domain-containing protein